MKDRGIARMVAMAKAATAICAVFSTAAVKDKNVAQVPGVAEGRNNGKQRHWREQKAVVGPDHRKSIREMPGV